MPELPEVELVVRALNKLVKGKRILKALLHREKLAPETPSKIFSKQLRNCVLKGITRRGKHILIGLSNSKTLIVHLRMSGRFMLLPLEENDPKFSHAVFYLENKQKLVFQDQRHFGFMRIVETAEVYETKELKKLAPEPFSKEFSKSYFLNNLRSSKRRIKDFLLDQTKVSGLGNIYSVEALFLARLNPQIRTDRVSTVKANRLHRYIIEVLQESIDYSSTLNVDPENFEGNYYGGAYENQWRVYDRDGEPCVKCKTKIKRIKQGARSSYYCPRCQRI